MNLGYYLAALAILYVVGVAHLKAGTKLNDTLKELAPAVIVFGAISLLAWAAGIG